MNPDKYFDNYDFTSIIEQILKENNLANDDNNFSRHVEELNKKSGLLKKAYKAKDYFKDLPSLDNDFSSYVIITNTPFVEEAKREKFKFFMSTKIANKFQDRIKEYIFPYTDADNAILKQSGIVLLKFESFEEAKLAANALNGVGIDKSHKANAVTFMDYDKIISMQDESVPYSYVSLLDLISWEANNLTEMVLIKNKSSLLIGKVHYLKKEFLILFSIPNAGVVDAKWTPQGKFLVANEGTSLKIYGNNSMGHFDVRELNLSAKDFSFSNDENFMVTFTGNTEITGTQVKENAFIWDVLRTELIRGLAITRDEKFENFKWSADSQFLARLKNEVLIVYESPKMQMIMDPEMKVRQPLKDNIKNFYWFPNRNNIIGISERRSGNKLTESLLQFFEIPSRRAFQPSSLVDLEIISLEWHRNNKILAVLCKTVDKPKWSVRIFEFDNLYTNYKSAHSILSSGTEAIYYSMTIKWMGNELFVSPKIKENNLDALSVFPFNLDRQSLKIESWPSEKCLKNLKHSHFLPSPNGIHFLLACLDQNNNNSYGKVDLYAIFDNQMNFCRSLEFSQALESVKWDYGGRLFLVELNRRKDNEGMRLFDCEGNLIFDHKDNFLQSVVWRPRHFPKLDKGTEEESIKKKLNDIRKMYDEEDSEFLSVIDKQKRADLKKMKDKFMEVIKRRRQNWEESADARKELRIESPQVKVEHEFYVEEILKTEEILLESKEDY